MVDDIAIEAPSRASVLQTHFDRVKGLEQHWLEKTRRLDAELANARAEHTRWAREACKAFHALTQKEPV